ncbi:MAG: hypothetical protein ACQEQV_05945 [Fibrobacterota bacterium]
MVGEIDFQGGLTNSEKFSRLHSKEQALNASLTAYSGENVKEKSEERMQRPNEVEQRDQARLDDKEQEEQRRRERKRRKKKKSQQDEEDSRKGPPRSGGFVDFTA